MRIGAQVGVGIASALVVLVLGAAPALAADPVIAAAGDIACSPGDQSFNAGSGTSTLCRQGFTSNQLVNKGLTAVLPLGDNQYEDGTLAEFQGSYDPSWGRVKPITRPVMGNHERGGGGYFDYFNGVGALNGPAGQRGKGFYSYDVGFWHIVALNTNDKCSLVACNAGSEQELWLKADLAAHPAACTLAYWHEPLFSSKTTYSSGSTFWTDLYAAGAEVVLNGHVHNYERFAPQTPSGKYDAANGLRQFVVGTGGRSLESSGSAVKNSSVRISSSFGVLKLTLHPTSFDWQFVTEGGKLRDSGVAGCHGPVDTSAFPPAPPPPQTAKSEPPLRVAGHRCTVVGTPGDDLLVGTRKRDVICGLEGADRIRSRGGSDIISGDGGNDRVLGGNGLDRIFGGSGNDRLAGGRGDDRIYGDGGSDRLLGNSGNDRLVDRGGSDRVFGNSGNDVVISSLEGDGRDRIDGGRGRDRASVSRRDRVRGVERFFHFRRHRG